MSDLSEHMKQVEARVLAAVQKIAGTEEKNKKQIDRDVRTLMFMYRIQGRYQSPIYQAGKTKDKKTISDTKKSATAIIAILDDASASAFLAFPKPERMKKAAEFIVQQADAAFACVEQQKRASKKRYAQVLERDTLSIYEGYHGAETAKASDRLVSIYKNLKGHQDYSKYLTFVQEVFEAMEMEFPASAASTIRMRTRKQRLGN